MGADLARQEQRRALEEKIRTLIAERNQAKGSAQTILAEQIESARRQLKALG